MKKKKIEKILNVLIGSKKLYLGKNSLKRISKEKSWKGSGTSEDPFVIDSNDDVPLEFIFTTGNAHIRLKNLLLRKLTLIRCKNMTIENCEILHLRILNSHDITVKDCSIVKIKNVFSRANVFQNNATVPEIVKSLEKNYGENRIMVTFGTAGIIGLVYLTITCAEFYLLGAQATIDPTFLVFSLIYIVMAIPLLTTRILIRKLSPNKFENFKSVKIESLVELFNRNTSALLESQKGD